MKEYIAVRNNCEVTKVLFSEICFITRNARKIILRGDDDFVFYENMKNVVECLDSRFERILDSCYVNMERVKSVKGDKIIFDNGIELMMSRDAISKAKKLFYEYI